MSKEMQPSTGATDLGGLVGSLKDALSQLPSSDEIVIHDYEGKEYRLRGVLPARRQIAVFKSIAQMLESGQGLIAQKGPAEGANWLNIAVGLVTDEAVIEQLGKTFRTAFPDAAGKKDPLDIFPLEELLASLVPLLVRFLKRSGMAIAEAGG